MKHAAAFLLAGAFLMGCDASSNPFNSQDAADPTPPIEPTPPTDPDIPTTDAGIPIAVASDVTNVSFDPATGTVTVTGLTFDNTPITSIYTRTPSLDQDGFIAYTSQDDPLDRHFTALVAQGTSVLAATAASPTPRNRSFSGAYFERDGAYTPPTVTETTGLVTYVGTYAGLTNISDGNPQNLLSTTVTPTELQPGQAVLVDGDVVMNADFADVSVEGNVFNRRLLSSDGSQITDLPSLVLISSTIDTTGSFVGSVEYDVGDARSNTNEFVTVGSYAGVFGGPDASEIGGALRLDQFDGQSDPLGLVNELESGAFVLEACTGASTNPVCTQIP